MGAVALVAVLLFLAQLAWTFFSQGDLRGGLLAVGAGVLLIAISLYGGGSGR